MILHITFQRSMITKQYRMMVYCRDSLCLKLHPKCGSLEF